MTGEQCEHLHKVIENAVLNKGVEQAWSGRLIPWSSIILPSLVNDKSECNCLVQEEGSPEYRCEVCLMRAGLCVILKDT